jgi:hypothetical protein
LKTLYAAAALVFFAFFQRADSGAWNLSSVVAEIDGNDKAAPGQFSQLKAMKHLRTVKIKNMNDAFAKDLVGLNIKQLEISGDNMTRITSKAIATMPELRSISVLAPKMRGSYTEDIASIKSMRLVEMKNDALDDKALKAMCKAKQLDYLDITGNPAITDKGMVALKAQPKINGLMLPQQIGANGFANFVSLAELNYINIPKKDTDKCVKSLLASKFIRGLDLAHSDFSDAGMGYVGNRPELEFVDLAGTKVTDAGIMKLTDVRTLKKLVLADTHITDRALPHIAKACALVSTLDLSGTAITDAGLRVFNDITSIEDLNLHNTKITGEALKDLPGSISQLDVSNTAFSDKALPSLRHFIRLTGLNIGASNVSDRAVDQLPALNDLYILPNTFSEGALLRLIASKKIKSLHLGGEPTPKVASAAAAAGTKIISKEPSAPHAVNY